MAKMSFKVKIEDDGTVTIETGNLQGEHHTTADKFMKGLAELMGGEVKTKSLKGHHHHHADGTAHTHEHGDGHHHH